MIDMICGIAQPRHIMQRQKIPHAKPGLMRDTHQHMMRDPVKLAHRVARPVQMFQDLAANHHVK